MQTMIVSKTDSGTFRSLQDAVLAVPDNRSEWVRILVSPGIYEEKVWIRKENLEIIGHSPANTIFRWGDGAKKPRPNGCGEYGTFNTAVLLLAGQNIHLENITVENTAGPGSTAGQALALYAAADRCSFRNCRFVGWQDTIFAGDVHNCSMKNLMLPDFFDQSPVPAAHPVIRNYFENCYISGDVDFIFGPNTVYFDRCEIHSRERQSEDKAFITAASTPAEQEYGLVFSHCRLTGDSGDHSVYLGRPWRDFAKTAFLHCHMDSHICPEGWHNWGKARAEALCSYVEYHNLGPGAGAHARSPFSRQLSNPELEIYYSRENVLRGKDAWHGKTSPGAAL
ncbi:MAG: pectin methylesterase [Lachnospiraceae bacterium]|nr:pectin methylesterase [Lachnospiraceae bacterium]